MRIIARKAILELWDKYPDAEQPLRAGYAEVKRAKWRTPHDVKQRYRNASILSNNRVVFNIRGNKYRRVVAIRYDLQIVYIRFVGTHKEYDKINAEEV